MFSKINLSVLVIVAFVVSFMTTAKPVEAEFRIGHHRAVMGSVTAVASRLGYFDTTFGLFSRKATISGARVFLEFPARSFNKFKSAFSITDNFLINSTLGAARLFFSMSFK